MSIKPEKFLCAFNAKGWSRFDPKKLEYYAKKHLKDFKPQDTEENFCEDCQQTSNHIFYELQLVNRIKNEYDKDFAITFNLDINDIDDEVQELIIIQCPNCGNWRVAL